MQLIIGLGAIILMGLDTMNCGTMCNGLWDLVQWIMGLGAMDCGIVLC